MIQLVYVLNKMYRKYNCFFLTCKNDITLKSNLFQFYESINVHYFTSFSRLVNLKNIFMYCVLNSISELYVYTLFLFPPLLRSIKINRTSTGK